MTRRRKASPAVLAAKIVTVLVVAFAVSFSALPSIGLTLQLWGYDSAAKTVLLAFFNVLAWSGGLS